MSNLANQLVLAERQEVALGIRTLLARPLITERGDADAFDLVRRRQEPIARWFDYYCGWSVVVERRQGYARLLKVRAEPDASRPARRLRSGRSPFDRRRYTLLCVVAAELLSAPVTTVGLLADRVVQATAADPVVPSFDTASRAERMAYVDVLRLLESYGVLVVIDGATESFVASSEAKVLYRVNSTLLMRLLAAPNGPSRAAVAPAEVPLRFGELLGALTAERRYGAAADETPAPGAVSEVQRNLWLRHSVLRQLFDDPVLYRDRLSEAQLAYLASPTGRQLIRRAAEEAGFILEERAEGYLLVDPESVATDGKFPDDSSHAKVAALRLLDTITRTGAAPEQLVATAETLLRGSPSWAKAYQSDGGAARLVSDAVAVLSDFGLVHQVGDLVTAAPAAARYRLAPAEAGAEDCTISGKGNAS
jgi:uncharacterized protein (TIGR02678 family)